MKIVSEICLNKKMRPMINSKGKIFPPVYTIGENEKTFSAPGDSRWDYNCYRLMDFFASKIKQGYDRTFGEIKSVTDPFLSNNMLLVNPSLINTLKTELESYNNGNKTNNSLLTVTINASVKEMRNHECLQGISNYQLHETIKKASDCKVNMIYDFKTIKDNKGVFDHYKYDGFDNFFSFEKIQGEAASNGKFYQTTYKFYFNTIIGYLFTHNILCAGWCVIEPPFYRLSPLSNILFRMEFLPFTNNIKRILIQDTVLNSLGIIEKGKSVRKRIFRRIVEELTDYNLIDIKRIKNTSFTEVDCNRSFKKD